MLKMNGKMILMLVAAVCCTACSIKSDRMECPCHLSIAVDGNGSLEYTVQAWRGDKLEFNDKFIPCECPDGLFSKEIRRGDYDICISRGEFVVQEGEQIDSVYACRKACFLSRDEEEITLEPSKQFATVYLKYTIDSTLTGPVDFKVKGQVKGINPRSLKPVQGNYVYECNERSFGEFDFRIPRQDNDSFLLSVDIDSKGSRIASLQLADYILDAGYDWDAEMLSDIYISINCGKEGFDVSIMDWDCGMNVSPVM